MASLGSTGGQTGRRQMTRRTRSESLSSGSSGGGAPLNASLSDLSIGESTHHRSVEIYASRPAGSVHSTTSSNETVEGVREETRQQQNFQVGKPLHDDEEVFGAGASPTGNQCAAPVPIINQSAVVETQSVIPIHTQPSSAERRHLVQGVDAQTYYPAEACIFVANLPESKSDTVLEVAVTKAFATFGPVFVKIRRDSKNMPFAFCQYTDVKHAQNAQKEGKGLLIEGRPCRTEMVKANRCYVMFSRGGHQVNVAEARGHLLQFGDISKLEPLHDEAMKAMKLPGSVFVEYERFDPGRDIVAAYRFHDEYGVVAYDLKKSSSSQGSHHATYLARYEVDRRSIYVGNLPHNVENIEAIVRFAAAKVGTVENVQIIRKEPRHEGGRPTVFAFVEYARPDEALVAVDRLRGTVLVSNRIRVEKKKCADQGGQFRSTENFSARRGENADANDRNTEIMPATPARAIAGSGAAISASPSDVEQASPQSLTPEPEYRSTDLTPTAYHQGRAFVSPTHGYDTSPFINPEGYGQAQYVSPGQAPYVSPGQAQYINSGQAYQPVQYMSPNYALTPGGHHHQRYCQEQYQPATPYHGGNMSGYYQSPTPNAFWHTPYLQDQNNGYQYYAGYGHQQRTPMGIQTRSVISMNDGYTPTRAVDMAAQQQYAMQQHDVEGGEQTDEHAGENANEKE